MPGGAVWKEDAPMLLRPSVRGSSMSSQRRVVEGQGMGRYSPRLRWFDDADGPSTLRHAAFRLLPSESPPATMMAVLTANQTSKGNP